MDRDIKNIVMDKGYVQNTIFELLSRLGIGYEKLEQMCIRDSRCYISQPMKHLH